MDIPAKSYTICQTINKVTGLQSCSKNIPKRFECDELFLGFTMNYKPALKTSVYVFYLEFMYMEFNQGKTTSTRRCGVKS